MINYYYNEENDNIKKERYENFVKKYDKKELTYATIVQMRKEIFDSQGYLPSKCFDYYCQKEDDLVIYGEEYGKGKITRDDFDKIKCLVSVVIENIDAVAEIRRCDNYDEFEVEHFYFKFDEELKLYKQLLRTLFNIE